MVSCCVPVVCLSGFVQCCISVFPSLFPSSPNVSLTVPTRKHCICLFHSAPPQPHPNTPTPTYATTLPISSSDGIIPAPYSCTLSSVSSSDSSQSRVLLVGVGPVGAATPSTPSSGVVVVRGCAWTAAVGMLGWPARLLSISST